MINSANVVPLWNVYKYVTKMPLGRVSPIRTRVLVESGMTYKLAMIGLSQLPRSIVGNYYLEKAPIPKTN